ncbi:response regulator [Devosia sp. RR2S18]|uniref:response regulator n=1 Tax=Devosia rhizosphaerae TaxID=3049774 RepID=UPI002542203E|nr:response regulator [Devosia sp. RR2S18]WIJ24981.1 response regulator [Devosia sp. RR2S18]
MTADFDYRRILIVEDDCLLAMDIFDTVKEAGAMAIGPAPTVDVAIQLLESGPWPDFAILDINLHSETSYPIADLMIEHGTPFIFATSTTPDHVPERYRDFPFVGKPMDLMKLQQIAGKARLSSTRMYPEEGRHK